MEENILKVLEYIEDSKKNDVDFNDWGDAFPAGVTPYSLDNHEELNLNREIAEGFAVDKNDKVNEEKKTENIEHLQTREEKMTARLEKVDENIATLEKESSKILLKMDEIHSLIKKKKDEND